jgi:hypothetical protein
VGVALLFASGDRERRVGVALLFASGDMWVVLEELEGVGYWDGV